METLGPRVDRATEGLPTRFRNRRALPLHRALLDVLLALGLLFLLTLQRNGDFDAQYRVLAVLAGTLLLILYPVTGVYSPHQGFVWQAWRTVRGWFVLMSTLVLIAFITKTSELFSREVFVYWSLGGAALQIGGIALVNALDRRHRDQHARSTPAVIVGHGPGVGRLHTLLRQQNDIRVVGAVADDWTATEQLPRLGAMAELGSLVEDRGIRRVYLAFPMDEAHRIKPLYRELLNRNVDVVWVPDMHDMVLLNHQLHYIGSQPAITLSETPLAGANLLVKSAFDTVVSLAALVALAPLMGVVAVLIKLTSPGPVIYRQKRHGWDGRVFELWKFRSMVVHQEADGQVTQARRDDDRITWIGRFIRRTSIDELPQLVNVLQGHMSLVGPRPHAVAHNELYADQIDHYMLRHRIKPGLTGWAQVHGLRGETDTLEKMEARVQYDLAYINNWSLWLDVRILLKTIVVVAHPNAY